MTNSRALEMFQSGQRADCVIEVTPQIDGQDKQEFNVHTYVLMVNSDVFHAMFSHENTQEARESRIQITDSSPTAVHQMLIYLYTEELPSEYATETDAGPLLHLANKYQIKSLVQLIEPGLVNSLSLQNVFDCVELADLYQIKSLYSSCGQLIRRNLKTVKKEAKWLELKKKSPELAFAILEEFAEEFENSNVTARKVNTGLQGADLFGQKPSGGIFIGRAKPSGGIFTGPTASVPSFPVSTTASTSLFGTLAASAEPSTSGSIFSQTGSQAQQQTTGIYGQQQSAVMAPLSKIGNADPSTAKQQHELPQLGLHQIPLNRTIDTGNTHNFGNDLEEQKLMNANLESKNQALHTKAEKVELMPQGALENLELEAENRTLNENAEQKMNYQALEAKLSTQTEKQQKQVEQLESKNRMLEEKLKMLNLETKEKRTLDEKMEQLKDECSNSKKLPGLDVE